MGGVRNRARYGKYVGNIQFISPDVEGERRSYSHRKHHTSKRTLPEDDRRSLRTVIGLRAYVYLN